MDDLAKSESRIASIDALRGITIFTMIFVNDIAGGSGVPAWMQHFQPYDADGMTFVDLVFPAFLFIVGMAIPFSLGRRLDRGESRGAVWGHLLLRSLWLLIIGVFMVNGHEKFAPDAPLNSTVWSFLMYLAVILTWNAPPREPGRGRAIVLALRWVGIAMLVGLAFLFDNANLDGVMELRPLWWGILGLIGLAYLVAGSMYMLFRNSSTGLLGCAVLLFCVYMADKVGTFDSVWLRGYINFGTYLGGQAALVMLGILLGRVLAPGGIEGNWPRIRWALWYSLGMFVAGWLLYQLHGVHKMFIINKNEATPTWCLYSAAITTLVWVAIYLAMDVRGWRKWALVFAPGGANPLFAYILHPMAIYGFAILGWIVGTNLHAAANTGFLSVFMRAIVMALGVTWVAGWCMKKGVRLKL